VSTRAVRLRVPTEADIPLLDAWDASIEAKGEFNDFGLPPKSRATDDKFEPIKETSGTLLIVRVKDGRPVGSIDWRPSTGYGPPPESLAIQLGISLIPEARGQGYGPEALRLAVQYLFETTKTNRVEATTDVENLPSQKAILAAGFVYEGTIRQCQWRRGRYHDLMMFSVLRAETS